MQVHGNAKLRDLRPERRVLGLVEVARGPLVTDVRVAVDDGALGTELDDGALELCCGLLGILQGDRREEAEWSRWPATKSSSRRLFVERAALTATCKSLLAERPNEPWAWDITKLKGPAKWSSFYIYVIPDVYSRYAVGWTVQHRELPSRQGPDRPSQPSMPPARTLHPGRPHRPR